MGKGATPRGDRTAFLNATKSAAICETIKKEERAVYQLFQKQMELGRLQLPDEEELQPQPQPEEEADPDLIARLVGTAGQAATDEEADASGIKKERLQDISRSIWSVANPGYVNRETAYQSVSKSEFAWRESEVQAMRSRGELDVTHHRKRDGFTAFAEASLRSAHLQRRGGEPHKQQ